VKEREIVLQILGMHCAACATGIESGLKGLDGVIEVSVNFASKEATLFCCERSGPKSWKMEECFELFDGFGFSIVRLRILTGFCRT
jgi:copper chaperone CopZ